MCLWNFSSQIKFTLCTNTVIYTVGKSAPLPPSQLHTNAPWILPIFCTTLTPPPFLTCCSCWHKASPHRGKKETFLSYIIFLQFKYNTEIHWIQRHYDNKVRNLKRIRIWFFALKIPSSMPFFFLNCTCFAAWPTCHWLTWKFSPCAKRVSFTLVAKPPLMLQGAPSPWTSLVNLYC